MLTDLRRRSRNASLHAAFLFCALPLSLGAQSLADRLSIHGYLTQGYAVADSHQFVGISNEGTFNYRRAALLFRFRGTPKDAFVVQLANRELGLSPINDVTPELQLDWAFYEHRFGSRTTLRIGKLPIPIGIFNETRYVGTLLPFYRAPYGFYQEGAFVSESLNGLALSRDLIISDSWQLSGSLFGGDYSNLQAGISQSAGDAPPQYLVERGRTTNFIGVQLWLRTPVEGLRAGIGAERHDDHGAFANSPGVREWWTSVDWKRDRVTARAEYRYLLLGQNTGYFQAYYGQVGVRLMDKLMLNAQRDVADLQTLLPGGKEMFPFSHDNGLGLNYAFASNIVAKLEVHDISGVGFEEFVNPYGDGVDAKYLIASISVTF